MSYDRARVAEEYSLRQSQVRFLDTMSLHIIVNGMTSDQRLLMQKFSAMKVGFTSRSTGFRFPF